MERTERVNLKLSDAEHALIAKAAAAERLTVTAWVRSRVLLAAEREVTLDDALVRRAPGR